MKQYLFNLYLSTDRWINTLLGGSPQYTLSGRMGTDIQAGRCLVCKGVCWLLNFLQSDHCLRAAKHELELYGPPTDAADQGD